MYKKVDLTAPRFRISKYRYIALNQELFARFLEEHKNIQIDWSTFRNLIIAINEEFVDEVINNRDGVVLPKGLGRMYMCMFKPTKKLDYSPGLAQSLASDGLLGKIAWTHRDTRYKIDNARFYSFTAHRTFKRAAAHEFKTRPEFYIFESKITSKEENIKRINSERLKTNSQISDQPSEDTEQVSIFGQPND